MRITKDLTPVMVEEFLKSVDEMENLDEVLFEFKEFERLCLVGLYNRVYKAHPYNAMSIIELITDIERTKIKRIVHKK